MPFTPWVAVAGNTPLPLPVADGGTGAATAAAGLTALGGLVLQAATAQAGFALQNGTPTVVSWTAPNDGVNHRALVMCLKDTTSAETGGAVSLSATAPDNTAGSPQLNAGSQAGGLHQFIGNAEVKAGTTVSVVQSSALTAGAATLWAEIWGL